MKLMRDLLQLLLVFSSLISLLIHFLSVYVVVQFYPWFKFYFLLFWGMVIEVTGQDARKSMFTV